MNFRLNLKKLDDVTADDLVDVFREGFSVLGIRSPLALEPQRMGIARTSGVVWLMPFPSGQKKDSPAQLLYSSINEFYIQFETGNRKFNQLAAFECLIKLGVVEQVSDASDGGVF